MPDLVTSRGERIHLEPNRSYTLGRSAGCDIMLTDILCSRQHARLTVGGERTRGVIVEDLGSRNGTYVNENRIAGPTTAKEGCTVRFGATVYTVRGVEEDPDDALLDTGTMAIEKMSFGADIDDGMLSLLRRGGGGRTEFAGKLQTFGLTDLLQMMIQHRRNGTLHLACEDGDGVIEVRKGEILAAEFAGFEGFEALLMLAEQTAGSFRLVETTRPCERTIDYPAHTLLVELCRALDEGATR